MGVLPRYDGADGGSGCDNEDCPATGRWVTVASRREIDLIFPRKDKLDWWPLPDQATHVCTSCGFVYDGVTGGQSFDAVKGDSVEVDISEWDWDEEMAYEASIRDATQALIDGAPDDTNISEIVEAVAQHVPGVGREFGHELLETEETDDS